ncbi:hypothetical protein ACF0H5_010528 [Mactra antiquata]
MYVQFSISVNKINCYLIVTAQDEIINATLEGQNVYSPGYLDGAYSNNIKYEFLITTWYTNHTIIITLLHCDIEHSIKECYDWINIYDGASDTADLLVDTFCCRSVDLPANQSTGNSLYIVFQSDSDVNGQGFKLRIVSDGPIPDVVNSTSTSTNSGVDIWNEYNWIIIGSAYGGLNLIGVFITVCFVFKKKDKVDTREPDLLMTSSQMNM